MISFSQTRPFPLPKFRFKVNQSPTGRSLQSLRPIPDVASSSVNLPPVIRGIQVRERATQLLAELLARLPKLPLSSSSAARFAEFFASRLADYPSVRLNIHTLLTSEIADGG